MQQTPRKIVMRSILFAEDTSEMRLPYKGTGLDRLFLLMFFFCVSFKIVPYISQGCYNMIPIKNKNWR